MQLDDSTDRVDAAEASRYARSSITREDEDSLARLSRMIEPGTTVLDLGAAEGVLGDALAAKGCVVDGVEIDQAAAAAAVARSKYRRIHCLDLESPDLSSIPQADGYDYIVCADVLEHLKEPAKLLGVVRSWLRPGGELLVSVPNIGYAGVVLELILGRFEYRPRGLLDETHVRFFTRASLIEILNRSGFGVTALEPLHLQLERSEFDRELLAQLPPPVLSAMVQRPDGLAYQFIARASPHSPNAPGIRRTVDDPELRFFSQLYWRAPDETYSEDRSARQSFTLGDGFHICELKLPPGTLVGALRWDPLDRPGLVRFGEFRLLRPDGQLLWSCDVERLAAQSRSGDLRWVSAPQAALLALGSDPWVELPLDAPIFLSEGAVARLEFTVEPFMEGARVTEALVKAERRTADAVSRSEDALRVLGVNTAALEQAVRSEGSEHRQLKRAWQSVEGELRVVMRTVASLAAQLDTSRQVQMSQLSKLEAIEAAFLASRPEVRVRRALDRGMRELYRLRRELGSREYEFELAAGASTEATGPGQWRSTGDDPQLELVPTGGKYPYGLVKLQHDLECDVDEAMLYFDVGSGYEPWAMVSVPAGSREIIIALPPNVCGLRLDPRESPGPFRLSTVRISEISFPALVRQRWGDLVRQTVSRPSTLPSQIRAAMRALGSRGLPSVARVTLGSPPPGQERTYAQWLRKYGTFTEDDRRRATAAISTFTYRPKISVVMPVYNAPEVLLNRAIESVRAQVYEDWELCIADDASTDPNVATVLASWASTDARIRPKRRDRNGHIAEATNSALEEATGEFTVFLDHDDELTPDALAVLVHALNRWPDTDLLYSDEDKIDAGGERFDPAFKPEWSPERLLGQNYVCHLMAIRTALIRRFGGMRVGFEGSQDHDLVLRIGEHVSADRIRHLPFVLYHWRAVSGSTAASDDAKPYAAGAGVRAVKEALERRGLAGDVTPGRAPYSYRARYALPDPAPRVTIIIPTRDGLALLRNCITSVQEKTLYGNYEIVIVDNDSADPETLEYLAELERFKQARILRYQKPFNFSAINNFAAEQATGSVLMLLNNDIEVITAEWLGEMVSLAVQPEVGAVGAMLLYPDGRIQHAGVVVGMGGVAGHAYKREPGTSWGRSRDLIVRHEVSAVTAACLAVEAEKFRRVGGLDAEHLRVAFNDVDFCLKLREAGLRNLWTPHAVLRHHESVSRGSDERPERRAAFQAEIAYMKSRWKHVLGHDPFFSPNYTFDYEIPQLAFPPRVAPFYREGSSP